MRATLVTIQGTQLTRLALLPFCLLFVFRVATCLDLPYPSASGLMVGRSLHWFFTSLILNLYTSPWLGGSSMGMNGWVLEPHHYVRVGKYGASGPAQTRSILDILYNGAELCSNLRGVG